MQNVRQCLASNFDHHQHSAQNLQFDQNHQPRFRIFFAIEQQAVDIVIVIFAFHRRHGRRNASVFFTTLKLKLKLKLSLMRSLMGSKIEFFI